jgi:Holliday junction resolvase RusA-like endonuclease
MFSHLEFDHLLMEVMEQFRKPSSGYDLPLTVQPKERSFKGHNKIKTRNWEQLVFEATEEDAPSELPRGRLALQALLFCPNYLGDISNMVKTLEDALKHRAYKDDRQIDVLNIARIVHPNANRTLVRILEKPI